MFIVAMALISVGYTLAYWGANNIMHWSGPDQNTLAAPMTLLFGVLDPSNPSALDDAEGHPVPFPYKPPPANPSPGSTNSDGSTNLPTPGGGSIAVPNTSGGKNGAAFSPNSPIPQGVNPQGNNLHIPGLS